MTSRALIFPLSILTGDEALKANDPPMSKPPLGSRLKRIREGKGESIPRSQVPPSVRI